MPRTKSYLRARCAEHLKSNGINSELFMDGRDHGRYIGWFYEPSENRYWLVRLFHDKSGKEWIVSKAFINQLQDIHTLPIDNNAIIC